MNDEVDISRAEIERSFENAVERARKVVLVPELDVAGDAAHSDARRRHAVEVVRDHLDHRRADEPDTPAPAEGLLDAHHFLKSFCATSGRSGSMRRLSSCVSGNSMPCCAAVWSITPRSFWSHHFGCAAIVSHTRSAQLSPLEIFR